jgi:hypothetical protein
MHSGGGGAGGGDKIEYPVQNFEKLVMKIQPEKGQLPCYLPSSIPYQEFLAKHKRPYHLDV